MKHLDIGVVQEWYAEEFKRLLDIFNNRSNAGSYAIIVFNKKTYDFSTPFTLKEKEEQQRWGEEIIVYLLKVKSNYLIETALYKDEDEDVYINDPSFGLIYHFERAFEGRTHSDALVTDSNPADDGNLCYACIFNRKSNVIESVDRCINVVNEETCEERVQRIANKRDQ